MFNLIPHSGIFKADIVPLLDESFDQEEFRRRIELEISGARLSFATPEDVILSNSDGTGRERTYPAEGSTTPETSPRRRERVWIETTWIDGPQFSA